MITKKIAKFGQNDSSIYKKKPTLLAKMWTKQWIIWPEWGENGG
jgi:hypothetical protein